MKDKEGNRREIQRWCVWCVCVCVEGQVGTGVERSGDGQSAFSVWPLSSPLCISLSQPGYKDQWACPPLSNPKPFQVLGGEDVGLRFILQTK